MFTTLMMVQLAYADLGLREKRDWRKDILPPQQKTMEVEYTLHPNCKAFLDGKEVPVEAIEGYQANFVVQDGLIIRIDAISPKKE